MALAGPAGAAFGVAAVFLVSGIIPVFLAAAAILIPRLDRDELAHPLDYPAAVTRDATDPSSEKTVESDS
jgi:hypothetical protein